MDNIHSSGHLGQTPIGLNYAYWISEEGVKASIPYPPKHIICGSVSEARKVCQDYFENRVKECIELL